MLFIDYPDENTPAAELKAQMSSASKVVNLTRPQKVELAGEELLEFRRLAEEKRRLKEEAIQKQLREQELAMLTAVKGAEAEDTDEEDEEEDDEGQGQGDGAGVDEEDESEEAAAARQVKDEKRKEKKDAKVALHVKRAPASPSSHSRCLRCLKRLKRISPAMNMAPLLRISS